MSFIVVVSEYRDKKKFQRKQGIQFILNRINEKYEKYFVYPFSLKDNFQMIGVLHPTENVLKVILHLKKEFFPLQVVCGIGIGSVNENFSDGEAFSLANEALEEVKNLKHKKETALSDTIVRIQNDNGIKEMAINTVYKLLYIIESHWTNKQRNVIHTMMFEYVTQAQVANMYEVSASNITQMLSNGHYFVYKEAIEIVDVLLNDAFEGISVE